MFVVAIAAVMLVAPSLATASTGDIIAPQSPPNASTDGWQAGTCTEEPPERAEVCSVGHRGPVLRNRRRAIPLGLHPVHRQNTPAAGPLETPDRRN